MKDQPRQLLVVGAIVAMAVLTMQFGPKLFGSHAPAHETATAQQGETQPSGSHAPPGASRDLSHAASATIETDDFVATVSSLNGGISSFRLKGKHFTQPNGRPIDLVTTNHEEYLPLRAELEG